MGERLYLYYAQSDTAGDEGPFTTRDEAVAYVENGGGGSVVEE